MTGAGRQRIVSGILMVCSVLAFAGALQAAPSSVTLEDVILLARADISDETILAFLDYREVDFELGPDEILGLREAGVSEEIIRYLLERTGARLEQVPVTRDYYYPSRYYATYYGPGAGIYLGASILPHSWWYDFHYLHLGGHHLGPNHHGLTRYGHGSVSHASINGLGGHRVGHLAGGHVGRQALHHRDNRHPAGGRVGGGHSSTVGHSRRSHLAVGHRVTGHARSGHSSRSHSDGRVGHGGGRGGHGGGSHGGGHGGGSHGGGHGGGSHGGGR
ncbi:MAG: hypothetical protein IH936_15150 [Acidobacteria bacterium]|nr:hypothetical protein [Acidobacteriota bacterium]